MPLFEDEDEESVKLNAFDWDGIDGFRDILNEGGFDVVIGNPPYVRVQELDYHVIDYLKSKYKTAWKRIDISILFIELANRLLRPNGINGYITSNQFLCTEYGRKAREFLADIGICRIVDFGDLPIFKGALTYVSVFFLTKNRSKFFEYCKVQKLDTDLESCQFSRISTAGLGGEPWSLGKADTMSIIGQLRRKHPPLSEIAKCLYGIITGLDDVLIVDEGKRKEYGLEKGALLPLIRAQDCNRHSYVMPSKYVIYPYQEEDGATLLMDEGNLKKTFPNTYHYLLSHKSELSSRKDSRKTVLQGRAWYSLIRFGQLQVFSKPKLVTPGEVKISKFALDESRSGYSGARVYGIVCNDDSISLHALLGVLNSRVVQSFMHSVAPLKQGGYYSYASSFIETIPIPTILTKSDHGLTKRLCDSVLMLLSLNAKLDKTKTGQEMTIVTRQIDSIDKKIEDTVYEMYGLTAKDIKTIEDIE
jgi:hypothetical protein